MNRRHFLRNGLWVAAAPTILIPRSRAANIAAFLGGSPFGTGSTLNNNLVAYYKMDETSDGSGAVTRADSSGNGLDLTDNSPFAASTASGKISNALLLVGANSEFLSRANNSLLQMGDIDMSVAAWVFPTSLTISHFVVAKWNTASNTREYALLINLPPTEKARFQVSVDGTANIGVNSTAADLAINTWYLLVGAYDSVNDLLKVSVNGGTYDTAAHSTGIRSDTSELHIGNAHSSNYFDGRIDEVGIWKNKCLSQSEVTELYAAGAGKTCCPFAAP